MYKNGLKRILAIFLSFLGLILLSWLFLILIVAIKLDSKGPVFFKQRRIGLHKKEFFILKFRTMRVDTPHDMPTHMLSNPDQFITRVGRFLRKTSLDELPQLWNIFVGDMAVIGPRPALWNQYDLIAERDKYGANDVRPGLTGWAQIHGRDELEIEEKARLDGFYTEHIGFVMDLKCFFGTIVSVLKSDGVVEGGTGVLHAEETARKTVLIITNHSYMLYRFRRELIEELQKTCDVVISTPFTGHENDFADMGVRCIETAVDRRGINPVTDWKLQRTYSRILKQEKPDLVITYSIKPNIYAGLLCGKRGIPFCANVQGLGTAFQKKWLAGFVTLLYKKAFKRVRTVFFENDANAAVFVQRGILQPDKITRLNGAGVNLEQYAYAPYPANQPLRFLYLGRIMREKGIDELFAAVERLHADGERFVLDLVGFFEDTYKAQVDALVEKGVAVFHGFQEEPIPYYQNADCVVLPSWHEGMSNVLLEAASIGRPLITNDIPGCREAVDDRGSGLLCEAKNTDSLYEAMKTMLSLSAAEREQMGRAGRTKIEREFDKAAVVNETVRALGIQTARVNQAATV